MALEAGTDVLSDAATLKLRLVGGYRLIDTASIYKNETAVGQALRDWPGSSGTSTRSRHIALPTVPHAHEHAKHLVERRQSIC